MTASIELVEDSFAKLASLDNRSVDVVLTDPPYNAHVQDNMCSGSLVGVKSVPKYVLSFDALRSFAFVSDLVRVSRRWVVMFCALEDFGIIKEVAGDAYVRGCVWYKPNAMGQLTGDRPATSFEGVALLHNPAEKLRWNGRGSFGIWKCSGTRGKRNRHPNEKPLYLCRKLAALFSEPSETVFDPFCGSAAIGEAATSLGRSYAGWDKDEYWTRRADRRLRAVKPYEGDALALCRMNGDQADEPMSEDDELQPVVGVA